MSNPDPDYPYKTRIETTKRPSKFLPKELAFTDWFDGGVKPVHPGVYQRRFYDECRSLIMYSYWTGENWGQLAGTIEHAVRWKDTRSTHQEMRWRGLL